MRDDVESVRNSEAGTLFGSSPTSLHPSLSRDHVDPEVITISDYSGSKGMSKTSLEGDVSSYVLLDALISNVGGRTDHVDVLIPLLVMLEEEILDNFQRRDLAKYCVRSILQIIDHESSDVEVLEY